MGLLLSTKVVSAGVQSSKSPSNRTGADCPWSMIGDAPNKTMHEVRKQYGMRSMDLTKVALFARMFVAPMGLPPANSVLMR